MTTSGFACAPVWTLTVFRSRYFWGRGILVTNPALLVTCLPRKWQPPKNHKPNSSSYTTYMSYGLSLILMRTTTYQ